MSRGVRHELSALCAWWIHELQGIWETLLARVAPPLATRAVVDFHSGSASISVMHGLVPQKTLRFSIDEPFDLPASLRGVRAVLAVPADEVLVHQLRFPQAVKGDLQSAIALHLERGLPLPLERVCVFHRIAAHEPARRQVVVKIFIARRDRVDKIHWLAMQWGLRPIQIGVREGSAAVIGDFRGCRGRFDRANLTTFDRRLAGVAAALLIGIVGLIAGQWIYERIAVGREVRHARDIARDVERLEQKLVRESAPGIALSRVSAAADAADALTALTEAVASDSWVYDVGINAPSVAAAQITLTGFTPAATMLVEALERAPHFQKVRLVSAVSAGLGTAQDRAELAAEWRPE